MDSGAPALSATFSAGFGFSPHPARANKHPALRATRNFRKKLPLVDGQDSLGRLYICLNDSSGKHYWPHEKARATFSDHFGFFVILCPHHRTREPCVYLKRGSRLTFGFTTLTDYRPVWWRYEHHLINTLTLPVFWERLKVPSSLASRNQAVSPLFQLAETKRCQFLLYVLKACWRARGGAVSADAMERTMNENIPTIWIPTEMAAASNFPRTSTGASSSVFSKPDDLSEVTSNKRLNNSGHLGGL